MADKRPLNTLEVAEIRYIHHIGAYAGGSKTVMTGSFGRKVATYKPQVRPDTVKLLENYIFWAPLRRWDGIDGKLMLYHARVRLARIKKERNALTT